jgi:hypothetical protein
MNLTHIYLRPTFLWVKISCHLKGDQLLNILLSLIVIRTYFKNNLSAHGSVAKRFKMLVRHRSLADSAFSPFRALPCALILFLR